MVFSQQLWRDIEEISNKLIALEQIRADPSQNLVAEYCFLLVDRDFLNFSLFVVYKW